MKRLAVAFVLLCGCKSAAHKACFDETKSEKDRVTSCGEACQGGDKDACVEETTVGLDGCTNKQDAEICRWMCLYGRKVNDLYCNEYEKITGKKVDEIPK